MCGRGLILNCIYFTVLFLIWLLKKTFFFFFFASPGGTRPAISLRVAPDHAVQTHTVWLWILHSAGSAKPTDRHQRRLGQCRRRPAEKSVRSDHLDDPELRQCTRWQRVGHGQWNLDEIINRSPRFKVQITDCKSPSVRTPLKMALCYISTERIYERLSVLSSIPVRPYQRFKSAVALLFF